MNESLLGLLREVVHEGTVYDHLLGKAGVHTGLLTCIQIFLIKTLHAVVKTLSGGVEKVLCAGLEINEVVTFHFVFYIISRALSINCSRKLAAIIYKC